MPSAVRVIFQYDTMKAEADLGRLVVITNDATRRMAARINQQVATYGDSAIPESMGGQMQSAGTKAGNNFGKGFGMGAGAVAAPMFISVLRDSAASFASGAPLAQIIGQQGPQVIQAFSMMYQRVAAVILKAFGPVAAFFGAGVGAWWLGGKVGEGIFGGQFDAQNAGLAARADRYRELRKEAVELAKAEKAVQDQRDRERNSAYSKYTELNTLMFENRVKNTKDPALAHQMTLDKLKSDLELARVEMEVKKGYQFNDNPVFKQQYTEAAIKLEQSKQAIIDENTRYAETIKKAQVAQPQVTERERIGLGAAAAVNVSILDINKQSLAVQKQMRDLLRRGTAESDGSF